MEFLHGGNIYDDSIQQMCRESGEELLDFSANINPLGIPEGVRRAVTEAIGKARHYPDPCCRKLKKALAEEYGLPETYFICGNGGADLIYRLVYGMRPKKALLMAPTFAEYEQALKQTKTTCVFYEMGDNLQVGEDILEWMQKDLDVMFLCNPNNPTGLLMEQELLSEILKKAETQGILLVLDECFLDFTGQEERSLVPFTERYSGLFVLKSFTKMYAMPGIRLGYGISRNKELLQKMESAGQCWGVSVLASEAGAAALEEREYKKTAVELVKKERIFLKKELEELGLKVWPGQADYLFFQAPGIRDLYERLLPWGIIIRRCGNYRGLDDTFYRVAVKGRKENMRLIGCMAEVLGKTREKSWQKQL